MLHFQGQLHLPLVQCVFQLHEVVGVFWRKLWKLQ